MIQDKKIDEWSRELQKIEKDAGLNTNNDELMRLRKNLKERIRVRTKKILDGEIVAEPSSIATKTGKSPRGRIRTAVMAMVKKGISDPKRIAKECDCKVESVRWYLWKDKTK